MYGHGRGQAPPRTPLAVLLVAFGGVAACVFAALFNYRSLIVFGIAVVGGAVGSLATFLFIWLTDRSRQ